MKSFLTAGLALAACAALAGVTEQTFESAEVGTKPTGWKGDAAVEASGDAERGKVLAVDGEAKCENAETASASQWGKTTFLVKAPEDATTDLPTAEDIGKVCQDEGCQDEGCQIAVATGAEADGDTTKLKVMVYQGGTTPAWVEAPNVTVTKGAWFTVVLDFDYSVSKVQVLVNRTSAGWFPLVTTQATTGSKINSLAFVGSTKVDNVSIVEQANVPAEALPEAIKTLSIDLLERGVTIAEINDTETKYAGLTVAQRLESGLAPKGDATFSAKAMGANSITVPCDADNGQVYTIVVTDATGPKEVPATAGDIDSGKRTLTFTMPQTTGKVLKFQVKASAPTPTSAK